MANGTILPLIQHLLDVFDVEPNAAAFAEGCAIGFVKRHDELAFAFAHSFNDQIASRMIYVERRVPEPMLPNKPSCPGWNI